MDCRGLGQPFYMSDQRGWTKLTYASKKLDYAIKARKLGFCRGLAWDWWKDCNKH